MINLAGSPSAPGADVAAVRPGSRFANPALVTQSWYVAARSTALRRGQAATFDLLKRRITLYRDAVGAVHALDARCPHLGADLGQGRVRGDQLQCPFHHWRFGPDGACRVAPGLTALPHRRARVYPTLERWGLIWIFNGPQPLFALPEPLSAEQVRVLRLPAQQMQCHPHLVIGNGLDVRHIEALHGIALTRPPELQIEPPYRVTVALRGRPQAPLLRLLTGSRRQDAVAGFTTIGGNLAWVTVAQPVRFQVLFTAQPTSSGGCKTQVLIFTPRGLGWRSVQAVALLYTLLHDDRRILERLDFRHAFTEADAPLRAFADLVNGLDTW